MPIPTLGLPPDQAQYSAIVGKTSVSTKLDGGASRFRNDQLGAASVFNVQWTCSKKNYNYLMAFYRTSINYGADPFNISLLFDSGDMQTYIAHFVPETFGLTSQAGETYVVGAQIEIVPNAAYAAGDATIIAAGPDV